MFTDPFGLKAGCPPLCDNLNPASDRFFMPESQNEKLGFAAAYFGVAVAGLAAAEVLGGGSAAVAATAGPVVGPGTIKLGQALEEAGPQMSARMDAVVRWLPQGQKAVMTTLEGGGRMLSGGAGANARQVILNADGSTVIKAFDTAKKSFEIVKEIRPQ